MMMQHKHLNKAYEAMREFEDVYREFRDTEREIKQLNEALEKDYGGEGVCSVEWTVEWVVQYFKIEK